MPAFRQYLLVALVGLGWLGACVAARASSIYEPNNLPSKAYALPSGQLVVSDDLNGTAGRPDTILGEYNMTYSTLLASADNTPGVGNGYGSELLGVPLLFNGAALFRVTGAPDLNFEGTASNGTKLHTQSGEYSVTYKVYNPAHQLVKTVTQHDSVIPGMVDNLWLPPDNSIANWTGYTTDVVVNNVYGPGTGDSLDFFTFSGLAPNAPFTAKLTFAGFDALIGLYNGNTKIATGTLVGGIPTLTGFADGTGRVKIGVTGAGDDNFTGAHLQVGAYTLQVIQVPEPAGAALFGAGAALVCLWWKGRRGERGCRRAATDC
jgi:hypothetical protein